MVRGKRSVGGTNQTFAGQVATSGNGRLCKVVDYAKSRIGARAKDWLAAPRANADLCIITTS